MSGGRGGFAVGEDRQRAVEIAVVLMIVAVLGIVAVVPFLLAQRQHVHELTVHADLRQASMAMSTAGLRDAAPDSFASLVAAGYEPSRGIDPDTAEVQPDVPCIALRHVHSGGFWRLSAVDDGIVAGRCSDLPATASN